MITKPLGFFLSFVLTVIPVSAATVTVGGLILPSLKDENGSILADDSVVQVGFISSLPYNADLTDAEVVSAIDWNSFVALTGEGSSNSTGNYDTRISSLFGAGTFYGESLSFEQSDVLLEGLPLRVAVRIFDSASDLETAQYNTYTSSADSFILEAPDPLNPNGGRADFSINSFDDLGLIWQGTAFVTDVVNTEIPVDTDEDGLADLYETNTGLFVSAEDTGTDPNNPDTDNDGLSDGLEVIDYDSSPLLSDSDEDGLSDREEVFFTNTNPILADTDGNGILDADEDQDGDGLSDLVELKLHQTNPLLADSDDDGIDDGQEVILGFEPNEETTLDELVVKLSGAFEEITTKDGVIGALEEQKSVLTGQVGELTQTVAERDASIEELSLRPTQEAYDAIVVERDARFEDGDGDGITDLKEVELETNPAEATVFYLQDAYDLANEQSRLAGQVDVSSDPGAFGLVTSEQYTGVLTQRDALVLENGLQDTQIENLNQTVSSQEQSIETLEGEKAGLTAEVVELTQTVTTKDGVIGALEEQKSVLTGQVGELTQTVAERDASIEELSLRPTQEAYDAIVLERDARFEDGDGDGITDLKEVELETNPAEATVFYLQDAYDLANEQSLQEGRSDVVDNPQNYNLITLSEYQVVLAERDSRFVDGDGDGLTDQREGELGTNPLEQTVYYLKDSYDAAVLSANESGRMEVITNPQFFNLRTEEAYNLVVEQRDSRFLDSDTDGITDEKEDELGSEKGVKTIYYLQSAFDSAVDAATIEGRDEVILNPSHYDLTSKSLYDEVVEQRDARPTQEAYQAVLLERDERYLDSDNDGITDQKENELASDINSETIFYLEEAHLEGVALASQETREAILANPQDYGLTTLTNYNIVVSQRDARPTQDAYDLVVEQRDARPTREEYNAIILERDSRFVDSDLDGITDLKELELQTNTSTATAFYLQEAYDFSNAQSQQAGRDEVTNSPSSFDLYTSSEYNAVIAQRDARFVDSDGDGLTDQKEVELSSDPSAVDAFYLQGAFDEALAITREETLTEVLSAPANYNLYTKEAYDSIVWERDRRFLDSDRDGLTDIKEDELETDPNEGTAFYLENAEFDSAVAAARQLGRNDVIVFPLGYGLTSLESYNQVITERDSRFIDSDGDGITDLKEAELGSSPLVETAFYLRPAYIAAVADAQEKGRNQIIANPQFFNLISLDSYNAVVLERDSRPSSEAYAALQKDRDSRFVDSDGDGITDLKESEIRSNPAETTKFFLEADQVAALERSRDAGKNDVLQNLQNYGLTTSEAYNQIVAQRNARFLDTDGDGITDEKEGELGTDIESATLFYLENTFETLFGDAREAGRNDILLNPQNFALTSRQAYNSIIMQRDSRYLDTDGDGITDEKEQAVGTDSSSHTSFYLEDSYLSAVEQAQSNGRGEVITNPQNFGLTSSIAYASLLSQISERFLDSDGDGLTDLKEEELNTDPNAITAFAITQSTQEFQISLLKIDDGEGDPSPFEISQASVDPRYADADLDGITDAKEIELNTNPDEATLFYLQDSFDAAVVSSREIGRNDVVTNPQNFDLISSAAYQDVIAQRDSLFADSDGDGLTDDKELELATDAQEETIYYLKSSYDWAVANARDSAESEILANPQAYSLRTETAYNLVVAQRDSRFLDSDGDGLTDEKEEEISSNSTESTVFFLQGALDSAVVSARDEGRNEVVTNPSNYALTSQELYDAVVEQRDARPTLEAYLEVVTQRDSRFEDSDGDGMIDAKEVELSTDPSEATIFYSDSIHQEALEEARVETRESILSSPQDYDLTTLANYEAVVAQRDARPTQSAYQFVVDQRDARPTQSEFNAVVAERDSRLTLDEVQEGRLGSVLIQPNLSSNRVKIRLRIEETEDFETWTSTEEATEIDVPLASGKRFYRFAIDQN